MLLWHENCYVQHGMEANTVGRSMASRCDKVESLCGTTVEGDVHGRSGDVRRFVCGRCIVGLCLTLLSLPALAIVALLVLVFDGRPVLYAGTRMGKHKRPFQMYKFRTLEVDAHSRIGSQLHSSRVGMETRLGKFLRDCRLDELPQLFNVFRGDMTFVGPRPVRPEVYESKCRSIPGYDQRFKVYPGIVGFSQLFTPHSTPKSVRSRIDNRLAARPCNQSQDIVLVVLAAASVIRSILRQAGHFLDQACMRLRRNRGDKRTTRRITGIDATAEMVSSDNSHVVIAPLYDMTDEAFRVTMPSRLEEGESFNIRMKVRVGRRRRGIRIKRAGCKGIVQALRNMDNGSYAVVIRYEPLSEASDYFLRKYFLRETFSGVG